MTKTFFITGIGTDIGKTVVSAIFCKALNADYWKPIQAGDLKNSDTHKVKAWTLHPENKFHPNSYALSSPMSPDAAADIDNVRINLDKIIRPQTQKPLVIEGAGGLLVPLNEKQFVSDLIQKKDHVVVVCKPYLGSINHTLLSLKYLQSKNLRYSLVFNGERHLSSEKSILRHANKEHTLHIEHCSNINAQFVESSAQRLSSQILQL